MTFIRRLSRIFLFLVGLSAWSLECLAGSIEQPGDVRGPLPGGQPAPVRSPAVGVQEVSRPDGGQDVIRFSLTPPEERQARQQAESQKNERAQEVLKNVIILR
jgi:hypothetical protein